VHQVGHYPELHQDAWSTKHKIMFKVLKQLIHVACRKHWLSTVVEQSQGDFPEVILYQAQ
jgi:hypothetical protein